MVNDFWDMIKNWADKYTAISEFKNWEQKLKARLHCFSEGRDLILSVDSEEMIDSSTTVLEFLKMCLKYFKPFPEIKTKIEKKLLSWRSNKGNVMKSILDLQILKCDTHRVKRMIDTKNQQEDELGVDLSHLAPETRKICYQALANKKRPSNNKSFSRNLNKQNPHHSNKRKTFKKSNRNPNSSNSRLIKKNNRYYIL